MLTVTSAASDPTLLTIAELAEAIGVSPSSPSLATLNARVSALLASACGLQRAGTAVLTLRAETLTETIRLDCGQDVLFLSRKPIIEILTVTEDGVELEEEDFDQRDNRSLFRLNGDGDPICWKSGKVEVSFRAGWDTVPDDLKALASKLAVSLYGERQRDPSLRREVIPGVREQEFWVGAKDDPLITSEIMEGLNAGDYLMQERVY